MLILKRNFRSYDIWKSLQIRSKASENLRFLREPAFRARIRRIKWGRGYLISDIVVQEAISLCSSASDLHGYEKAQIKMRKGLPFPLLPGERWIIIATGRGCSSTPLGQLKYRLWNKRPTPSNDALKKLGPSPACARSGLSTPALFSMLPFAAS